MTDPSIITNEAEAWAVLAETIRNADGVWRADKQGTDRGGVCLALVELMMHAVLREPLLDQMLARAKRHRPTPTFGPIYWWPLDDTASRVRFCRRMARLAAREES